MKYKTAWFTSNEAGTKNTHKDKMNQIVTSLTAPGALAHTVGWGVGGAGTMQMLFWGGVHAHYL